MARAVKPETTPEDIAADIAALVASGAFTQEEAEALSPEDRATAVAQLPDPDAGPDSNAATNVSGDKVSDEPAALAEANDKRPGDPTQDVAGDPSPTIGPEPLAALPTEELAPAQSQATATEAVAATTGVAAPLAGPDVVQLQPSAVTTRAEPVDQVSGDVVHMQLFMEEFVNKARDIAHRVEGGMEAIIAAVAEKLRA